MRPFLHTVGGRHPPGFSPFGSSAHPHCGLQTPARNAPLLAKNVRVFIYLPHAFENLTNFIHRLF
jgi:hypothetical protein